MKALRLDRVEEVKLMVQARAIRDFFWNLAAVKKCDQVRSTMMQRIRFRDWAVEDPHFARRLKEIAVIKNEARCVLFQLH